MSAVTSAVLDTNMRSQRVATQGAIRIEDVVKIYDPDGAAVMAVDHCSLDIPDDHAYLTGGRSEEHTSELQSL